MMKILSKYIAASAQIHNGKCYFVGLVSESDGAANNIEDSGDAATTNQVGITRRGYIGTCILPLPGIECSNGLYVATEGKAIVYYSI